MNTVTALPTAAHLDDVRIPVARKPGLREAPASLATSTLAAAIALAVTRGLVEQVSRERLPLE